MIQSYCTLCDVEIAQFCMCWLSIETVGHAGVKCNNLPVRSPLSVKCHNLYLNFLYCTSNSPFKSALMTEVYANKHDSILNDKKCHLIIVLPTNYTHECVCLCGWLFLEFYSNLLNFNYSFSSF